MNRKKRTLLDDFLAEEAETAALLELLERDGELVRKLIREVEERETKLEFREKVSPTRVKGE